MSKFFLIDKVNIDGMDVITEGIHAGDGIIVRTRTSNIINSVMYLEGKELRPVYNEQEEVEYYTIEEISDRMKYAEE